MWIEVELLSHLRTHLSRITVNGLTTTNHNVRHTDLADSLRKGITGGKGIGTGKGAVSQQITAIGTAIKAFTNHLRGTGRTHGEDMDGRTGILFFQSERLFKRIQVFGVKDGGQRGTIHRTFGSHGILTHVAGVGHLLCKHNNFQTHCL